MIPIEVDKDWNVITRTILPQIWQPAIVPGQGSTFGLGDIQLSAFLSPAQPGPCGRDNKLLLQPLRNYNFPGRLYLTTSPIVTVNWEADSSQRWTVPLGGGTGKIFHIGKLPVNTQFGGYYDVMHPDDGASCQLRLQVQFMFPK